MKKTVTITITDNQFRIDLTHKGKTTTEINKKTIYGCKSDCNAFEEDKAISERLYDALSDLTTPLYHVMKNLK